MKKSIVTLACFGLLGFMAFVGCKEAPKEDTEVVVEATFDLAMAKQEIIAANNEWKSKFEASDSAGVANLYAPDGKIMMNGAPAIVGRAQIQSTLHGLISSGVTGIDLTTLDVWGTEDMVTEEGQLALYVGDQKVDQGKFLVLWKKIDGKWYLFRDCFNSDNPPQE